MFYLESWTTFLSVISIVVMVVMIWILMNVYRISEIIMAWGKKMWNYPDGMSGREFDSQECEVKCPGCGEEFWDEVFTQFGPPTQWDTKCHECDLEFLATYKYMNYSKEDF